MEICDLEPHASRIVAIVHCEAGKLCSLWCRRLCLENRFKRRGGICPQSPGQKENQTGSALR